MSFLGNLLWGTSQLDDAVDKATSELLPSGAEDIALNLEICDQIRSKSVAPKEAMRALKRRLNHKNPNVQLLALNLTDVCVKNGGDFFLNEIASREFMDNLVSILKMPALNYDVKNKILRYIQDWATAFEGKPTLSYAGEVYKTLRSEGFKFPPRDPAVTSSAMVDTKTAPEWVDSDVCLRCRTAFSFTNRKHHCRNCGQVFDQQCSSKSMPLPHFGIAQEVRVCDSCHTKLTKKSTKSHRSSQSVSGSRHRSARDLADAELQRAIQLSLEEVGSARGYRPGYLPAEPSHTWQSSEPPVIDRRTYPSHASNSGADGDEEDADLKAAIEASLAEANAAKPSAPLSIETPRFEESRFAYGAGPGYPQSYPPSTTTPKPTAPSIPSYDLEPLESDAILTFNQTVEQIQAQGGRDISRYPAVTELFEKANGLRPKLAMGLNDTGRKEQLLSDMHDKLSQAVKLYDKLLTEQISHPPWRASSAVPSASYQQNDATYAPRYAPADVTYDQWQSDMRSRVTSPPVQGQQLSYFGAPALRDHVPYADSPVYVSSPVSEAYPTQVYNPSQSLSTPLQEQRQYIPPPTQYERASAPTTVSQYNSPDSSSHNAYPASVAAPIQSPPQQWSAQYVQPPGPSSHLPSRHNTVSVGTPSVIPSPPIMNVARHNTISHAPQQLQQLQQTVTPTQLPNFPSVPTTAPQSYHVYRSIPEPERKEALLIDL